MAKARSCKALATNAFPASLSCLASVATITITTAAADPPEEEEVAAAEVEEGGVAAAIFMEVVAAEALVKDRRTLRRRQSFSLVETSPPQAIARTTIVDLLML